MLPNEESAQFPNDGCHLYVITVLYLELQWKITPVLSTQGVFLAQHAFSFIMGSLGLSFNFYAHDYFFKVPLTIPIVNYINIRWLGLLSYTSLKVPQCGEMQVNNLKAW